MQASSQKQINSSPTHKRQNKSFLFLNKLKRISSIDRNLRKKWSQLQQQRIKEYQDKEIQYLNAVRIMIKSQQQTNVVVLKSVPVNQAALCKNEQYVVNTFEIDSLPKVNRIREQIRRQEAHLRKKNYDEIYFRKKNRKSKPLYKSQNIKILHTQQSPSRQKTRSPEHSSQMKGDKNPSYNLRKLKTENNMPYILKKRQKAIERQYNIIDKKYKNQLNLINKKKCSEELQNCNSQVSMLKRLKDKKFYYKFTSAWSSKPGEDCIE